MATLSPIEITINSKDLQIVLEMMNLVLIQASKLVESSNIALDKATQLIDKSNNKLSGDE